VITLCSPPSTGRCRFAKSAPKSVAPFPSPEESRFTCLREAGASLRRRQAEALPQFQDGEAAILLHCRSGSVIRESFL
jgi:hypothetical protein